MKFRAYPIIHVIWLASLIANAGYSQSNIDQKKIESLRKIFGDSITVSTKMLRLTLEEKKKIAEQTRFPWSTDSILVYVCSDTNHSLGYGFIDNVKGKTQLITYLVALKPGGEVQDVDVLAYRESYGGEIGYESFRKQFRNKTIRDKLQPGKDIKNISGATISVHAITNGIKRILATFEIIKPHLN